MPDIADARAALRRHADPEKGTFLQRFFKTGPGEYAEGDQFIGVTVPQTRRVAREFRDLPLEQVFELLRSAVHEDRLLALIILTLRFKKGDREPIYRGYLEHTAFINNWDLVDVSAPNIVGEYLKDRSTAVLRKLARSASLWERRIAIMATFAFIREGRFDDTLAIAKILLRDPHDLIHKAVGWMLREVGNRDLAAEEAFLAEHYGEMPRTMLRYAIEKFPEMRRRAYLTGAV